METTPCPKCGQDIPSDAVDCPFCGIVVAKFRNAPPRREPSGAHTPPGASEPPATAVSAPASAAVSAPASAPAATPPPAPAAREILYDPDAPTPVYTGAGVGGAGGFVASSPHGPVTDTMIENLTRSGPWAVFLSVLWFLGALLTALAMVVGMVVGAAVEGGRAPTVSFLPGTIMVILYVFLALNLFNFGQAARRVGRAGGVETVTEKMEEALRYMRSFWRLVGILTLVVLSLAILGIVAAIVIPMLLSSGGGGP